MQLKCINRSSMCLKRFGFQFLLILSLYSRSIADKNADNDACWRDTKARGIGTIPDSCPLDYEKDGVLCYPICKRGYKGVGPVCWEDCKSNYKDVGVFCIITLDVYQKGCCCFFGSCCHNCKPGYVDDGCTCRNPGDSYVKVSYGRGAGESLICPRDKELYAGLCYVPCPIGYNGVGPVCWKQCTGSLPQECGATCTNNERTCSRIVQSQVLGVVEAAGTIAAAVLDDSKLAKALGKEVVKNIYEGYFIFCKN